MTTSYSLFESENIHPLAGVAPTLADKDLAPLDTIVRAAKVVALGEPTHGQKEINQLRDRITRYLVRHHGFRVVAMEDSAIKCRLVNDYIVHGMGTALDALSQQNYWSWRTKETLALIEWLRTWNIEHPDQKVRFIGVDIQDLAAAAADVDDLLSTTSISTDHQDILEAIGNVKIWESQPVTDEVFDEYHAVLAHLQENVLELLTHDPDLRAQGLDSILALTQGIDLWQEIVHAAGVQTAERWNKRDRAMASRTLEPVQHGKKVILWAHNGHIQSDRLKGMPDGLMTVGQFLKSSLDSAYVVIAGLFGTGAYRGINTQTLQHDVLDVGDPPENTIDGELWHSSRAPALLVDLKCADSNQAPETYTRTAGAALEPSAGMIAEIRPSIAWTAIAFVHCASPSVPA